MWITTITRHAQEYSRMRMMSSGPQKTTGGFFAAAEPGGKRDPGGRMSGSLHHRAGVGQAYHTTTINPPAKKNENIFNNHVLTSE